MADGMENEDFRSVSGETTASRDYLPAPAGPAALAALPAPAQRPARRVAWEEFKRKNIRRHNELGQAMELCTQREANSFAASGAFLVASSFGLLGATGWAIAAPPGGIAMLGPLVSIAGAAVLCRVSAGIFRRNADSLCAKYQGSAALPSPEAAPSPAPAQLAAPAQPAAAAAAMAEKAQQAFERALSEGQDLVKDPLIPFALADDAPHSHCLRITHEEEKIFDFGIRPALKLSAALHKLMADGKPGAALDMPPVLMTVVNSGRLPLPRLSLPGRPAVAARSPQQNAGAGGAAKL